jgi:exopolyphosphatase/guanosine-5'-triphosphate,3'-diphosphate pyrophosphatase
MAKAARRQHPEGDRPDRAVIDIGSNTVRLVVYAGSRRAPEVWLNEKVSAKLGRDLSATGRMPAKAMDLALTALARFATILPDLGIEDVQTVATAAVRDAENGPEFLERVRALGLEPRLLSGEEEARTSAMGVIGAFPGARGTVADLGGGSLELIMIEGDDLREGVSLPLGTLRLPALRQQGPLAFEQAVDREMARAGWAAAHPGPLYMVGGTWRAMAAYAMRQTDHPLTDPHGLCIPTEDADRLAKKIARMTPAELAPIRGISASRAAGLPDAAAMLRVMLAELKPDGLVFSSWGLREGLLFTRLTPGARAQDPLLAAIAHFTYPRGGSPAEAAMIAAWTADVVQGAGPNSDTRGSERLRLAATMLALATARLEPNLRARHAYDWAMDKRWLGLPPEGRARLAAMLLAACGRPGVPEALLRLAGAEALREAAAWGLAVRLCRRIGAGTQVSLLTSSLRREADRLVLWFDPARAQLASDLVVSDLKALAQWLGLAHEVRVGEAAAAAAVNHSLI